jgi:hypothetical protein
VCCNFSLVTVPTVPMNSVFKLLIHMWIVYSLCWYAHSSRSCSGLSVFWHWHYIGLFLLLLVSLSLTLLLLFNGGYLTSARICQPRASIWPLVLSMPRRNDVIHQLVDVAQRSSCVSWSIVINYHSTLLIVLKRPSTFFDQPRSVNLYNLD